MKNHAHSCSCRSAHESEGTSKYQELRLLVQKLWYVKGTVVPTVVGALGKVSEELENHIKTIGMPCYKLLIESSIARKSFHPWEGP